MTREAQFLKNKSFPGRGLPHVSRSSAGRVVTLWWQRGGGSSTVEAVAKDGRQQRTTQRKMGGRELHAERRERSAAVVLFPDETALCTAV